MFHKPVQSNRINEPTMTAELAQRISVRPDSQGRVTIPNWLREYLDLESVDADVVWISVTVHGEDGVNAKFSSKIDQRGRITIPAEIRRILSISNTSDYIELTVYGLDPKKHSDTGSRY